MEKQILNAMSNEQEKAMLQAENEANGTTFNPDELDNEEEETATFLPDNEVAELDLNEVLAICQSAMRGKTHDLLKLNKFHHTVEERQQFQRKVLDEVDRQMNFIREIYRDFTDII